MEFTELIKTAKVDQVVLQRQQSKVKITGTLCLTSHHIIFSNRASDADELMLLYMAVEHLDRKLSGTGGMLTILCKDFTSFKLKIPGQEEAFNVAASIEALSTLESAASYYPFFLNRINFTIINDGWKMFTWDQEYNKFIGKSTNWRISSINNRHEVCSSYPSHVMVHAATTDEMMKKSARFRQGGRFPILCYLHNNDVPLLRSSQPLSGQNNNRCKDDEKLLSYALSGHVKKGQIIDTRNNQVATMHRTRGGGYESDHHYPQWKRRFHNIERPSFLNESVSRLFDACSDYLSGSWLSKLEASGWMSNIEDVLTAALNTARHIHLEAAPVLVHGDQGTDCTLQVTSLTQLLLNSKSRTIIGFEALITREWLWAGYPFTERHVKIGISPSKRKEHAPVFIMFLDCIHQIMLQYPSSFEFNEEFLLTLTEHVYSSEFGTFLFNNEWQRQQANVAEKTVSLWSYINRDEILSKFQNPIYEYDTNVLWPSVAPQSLSVWYGLFAKSTLSAGSGESNKQITEMIMTAKSENDALKTKAKGLQIEYEKLRITFMEENRNS